jgi:hypothetical protein
MIGSDPSPIKLKKTKNNNSLRFSGAESLLKESPSHVMSKAMLVLNPPEQEFKLSRTHLSPKNLHADTIIQNVQIKTPNGTKKPSLPHPSIKEEKEQV